VTTATGSRAIVVEDAGKKYAGRPVVDGVSLGVSAGEVVALLGPNGAGKTTMVEMIEGYRRPDSGTVQVLGADPWRASRAHRARIGLMLQSGGFDMRARPAETLWQYAAFHREPASPTALLDELGLRDVARTPYRRLSGGERQRLAFAVAVVGRPDVLILDEPTAGMDPEARAIVRARIEAARRDGRAVLLTSHDLADVERLADRIDILLAGRIVATGSPSELASARTPTLRFGLDRPLEPADEAALGRLLGGAIEVPRGGRGYEVGGAVPTPAVVAALAMWCAENGRLVTWSRTTGGSLEDVYLDLVGGAPSDDAEAVA
jgi:ABC-2 type transport system ATP-binding protein